MSTDSQIQKPWSKWHERLHQTLKEEPGLIPKGSTLLIAVSGGQDSMTLVKLINDLSRIYNWDLKVWHGDHGWHDKSEQIAKELEQWCKSNKLSFYLSKGSKKETHSEAQAREWRYEELKKIAYKLLNKSKTSRIFVLTGHTATDRAETLILNLARGTDLAGLSSLRKSRALSSEFQLVRPMLNFSREDTAEFCKQMLLPIWIDPSNSNINLSRNRIRKEVIPTLNSLYPGCSLRIASLAERLTFYKDDQKLLADLAIESLLHPEGLCRKKINNLPTTMKATLFARWIESYQGPQLSANQLAALSLKISANKDPGSYQMTKGWKINWNKNAIKIIPPSD